MSANAAQLLNGRVVIVRERGILVIGGEQIGGVDGVEVKTGRCENVTDTVRWALFDLAQQPRPSR